MALLDDTKDVLPLSSIAELLSAKLRTLKMYEEKNLLPQKESESKKLYSIQDVKKIAYVHYLASVRKINANGIKYILEILYEHMDEEHQSEFLSKAEAIMESLSGTDITDAESV